MLFTMTQLMNCQFTWRGISKHEKTFCISFGFFDFGFLYYTCCYRRPYLHYYC